MTDDELATLKELYSGSMPLAEIARRMGYSKSTIQCFIAEHRDMFPYRSKRVPPRTRELWVARIKAGRVTQRQAAKALGVSPVTIARWVKSWS